MLASCRADGWFKLNESMCYVTRMNKSAALRIHAYAHTHTHTHTQTHTCTYVRAHTRTYIYIHTHAHTHRSSRTYAMPEFVRWPTYVSHTHTCVMTHKMRLSWYAISMTWLSGFYEWVTLHVWKCVGVTHVTRMKVCRVMSHIRTSHVARMSELCHTYKCVRSRV